MKEICEWCKEPVRMMCQQGTEICSQLCARYAAKILFDDEERAKKFRKGQNNGVSKKISR